MDETCCKICHNFWTNHAMLMNLDLESLEPYLHIIFLKKDKKTDTLAVIDNYNFCDRQTDMATLWPTWPRGPSWWKEILTKNPAYRKHWICQPIRMVAPLPWNFFWYFFLERIELFFLRGVIKNLMVGCYFFKQIKWGGGRREGGGVFFMLMLLPTYVKRFIISRMGDFSQRRPSPT